MSFHDTRLNEFHPILVSDHITQLSKSLRFEFLGFLNSHVSLRGFPPLFKWVSDAKLSFGGHLIY